jgi:hypothetical protein
MERMEIEKDSDGFKEGKLRLPFHHEEGDGDAVQRPCVIAKQGGGCACAVHLDWRAQELGWAADASTQKEARQAGASSKPATKEQRRPRSISHVYF